MGLTFLSFPRRGESDWGRQPLKEKTSGHHTSDTTHQHAWTPEHTQNTPTGRLLWDTQTITLRTKGGCAAQAGFVGWGSWGGEGLWGAGSLAQALHAGHAAEGVVHLVDLRLVVLLGHVGRRRGTARHGRPASCGDPGLLLHFYDITPCDGGMVPP